jgi:hypothetical protein
MADRLDSLFDQVTSHGRAITADGLQSLRREAIKDGKLSAHDAEVLGKAVDLYNQQNPGREVTLLNLTEDYPGVGATEMTVRLEQGAPGAALTGTPSPSLTFHRFVVRQGFGAAFRDPISPRHLPYLVEDDRNPEGTRAMDVLNEIYVGQSTPFTSIRELQHFLNEQRADGAPHLDEDSKAGPLTLDAIRRRLIELVGVATMRTQFQPLVYSAQVMFQDMRGTSIEAGRRAGAEETAPDLYVNPLSDGELRAILEDRIRAAGGG